jgi:YHS domain-containing protein
MGLGQFSIFGAVEEKGGADFPGLVRMKVRVRDGLFDSRIAVVSGGGSAARENPRSELAGCPQGVHRKCRKAVVGGQWQVASGEFLGEWSVDEVRTRCTRAGRIFPVFLRLSFLPLRRRMRSVTWHGVGKGKAVAYPSGNSAQGGEMTTDPVCGMEVDEKSEFQMMFAGKKYFFCSDECRKEFAERPDEFVETAA